MMVCFGGQLSWQQVWNEGKQASRQCWMDRESFHWRVSHSNVGAVATDQMMLVLFALQVEWWLDQTKQKKSRCSTNVTSFVRCVFKLCRLLCSWNARQCTSCPSWCTCLGELAQLHNDISCKKHSSQEKCSLTLRGFGGARRPLTLLAATALLTPLPKVAFYRLHHGRQSDPQRHPDVPNQHGKRRQAILDFEVILQFRDWSHSFSNLTFVINNIGFTSNS